VATCAKIEDGEAHFHLPVSVRTVEVFHSRGAQRVLKLLDAQWRYAPDGRGYGEFLPASIMDLSSGGASLVVDRAPKPGSQVEVRFTLESINKTFLEVCEVARSARIAASAKNAAGIRFLTMDPRDERALTNFLRDVQIERRDRGLM
jgi:c-di-GMP-binding flagellar brake protein YcgR